MTIILNQNENFTLFIIHVQIANTILNQCISLCLYKIGHISFYPIKLSRYRRLCSTCMRKHILLVWYSLVWWPTILCCFSCTFHNEQPLNSINFLDTHALIAESRLCIIIMSSHSVHNRLTQISQNAKVWKTSSKFANLIAAMVRIIGCELHWFVFRWDHCLNSRVPIIGDRIIRSSNSAMV